ncbi:MAG TPA: ABC transporter substrate-binding protein [Longimicrobiales bacterium]|nr:ABC transporter substrate-binding protein [Longimicrobiales bacterium]
MRRRIVLSLLLLLPACGDPAPERVGVVVSGLPSRAAELAADALADDAAPPFELTVVRRDPISADTALAVAEMLAADARVLAVIGHSNSAASLAASQVYNQAGLVQIAPTTTAVAYGAAGPYSFRMVPGDDRQAAFIADHGQTGWPPASRIAIVYVNDDYGRSFYRELRPRLDDVVFEGIYSEQSDSAFLAGLARQLGEAQPDLLIWLGRPVPLRVAMAYLRDALPAMRTICGDACDNDAVYANRDQAFTGLRFVRFTDPAADNDAMSAFRRAYQEVAGAPPSSEAILTYDAVVVIAAAFGDGMRDRRRVRDYLHSLGRSRPPVAGLGGEVAFDEAGNLLRDYLLADVAAGGTVPVPVVLR